MSNLAHERRRHERVEEAVCAWLSFRRDGAAYGVLTLDIGMEGAQFSTTRSVDIGDQVMVHLQLPSASVDCRGQICWVTPTQHDQKYFGVRFVDLQETERDRLMRFIGRASVIDTKTMAATIH